MSIIAVSNIKGGVGKTATSVNLSYLASTEGHRTLLCDMDSQASASYYFRIRPKKKFNTNKFLKGGKHVERNIRGTDFELLDLLPADFSFRNIDIALDRAKKPRYRIERIFRPLKKEYDIIFIDCPPNVTLLFENIYQAADIILVPVIPTTLSLLALRKLAKFLEGIDKNNDKMKIFFSMVEKRKKMHVEMIRKITREFDTLPYAIPYMADVEKMGFYRKPVAAARPRSVAARAYVKLWSMLKPHMSGF